MDDFGSVSRPRKLRDVDTVLYEIDMLHYCLVALRDGKFSSERNYYLHIEGFLIHYRNLANFFGDKDGLKAGEPEYWSPRKLTESELATIKDQGPYKKYSAQISEYLSHCTHSRAERDRDWQPVAMYRFLKPCVDNFHKLFPPMPTWM